MISLTQLSKKLKISKQGLNARAKKIPRFHEKYTKIVKHRLMISDEGAKRLDYNRSDSLSSHRKTRKGVKNKAYSKNQLEHIVVSQQETIQSQQGSIHQLTNQVSRLSNKLSKQNQPRLNGRKSSVWHRLLLAFKK